MSAGWMPKRAAWSRSMTSDSLVLLDCWSEATSVSCGSFFSSPSRRGAHVVQLLDVGVLQRVLVLRA